MINVVNKKTYKDTGVYIGRPSPLGNPYTHLADRRTLAQNVVKTRDEAVARYAEWLDQQMSAKTGSWLKSYVIWQPNTGGPDS